MKTENFQLIDAINRDGLENNFWGVIDSPDIEEYFGCTNEYGISGQYLYIYHCERTKDVVSSYPSYPTYMLPNKLGGDVDGVILLYEL